MDCAADRSATGLTFHLPPFARSLAVVEVDFFPSPSTHLHLSKAAPDNRNRSRTCRPEGPPETVLQPRPKKIATSPLARKPDGPTTPVASGSRCRPIWPEVSF